LWSTAEDETRTQKTPDRTKGKASPWCRPSCVWVIQSICVGEKRKLIRSLSLQAAWFLQRSAVGLVSRDAQDGDSPCIYYYKGLFKPEMHVFCSYPETVNQTSASDVSRDINVCSSWAVASTRTEPDEPHCSGTAGFPCSSDRFVFIDRENSWKRSYNTLERLGYKARTQLSHTEENHQGWS